MELNKCKKVLSSDCPELVLEGMDDEETSIRDTREAFLKITMNFLRTMKMDELADRLQSSKNILLIQRHK